MKFASNSSLKRKIDSIPTAADTEENTNMVFSESGIFKTYYKLAVNHVKNLSLDEKIGQLLCNPIISLSSKIHFSPNFTKGRHVLSF